jgi:hypothetical protein
VNAIPVELRDRDQWVVWRREEHDGKPTKVPCTTTGQRASSTDPATWTSFEDARSAEGFDGMGYVFSADDPFAGIDLDDCFEGGDLHPSASKIVQALDSYTETSVSGRGLHVLVRGELNGSRRRTGKTPWRGEFEVYDQGRYFCMTGQLLAGAATTIEDRQAQLERVLGVVFPAPAKVARAADPAALDDRELLDRAFAATNGAKVERLYRGEADGYGSASEADLALCSLLAFWTGPDDPDRIDRLFRSSGLMRPKWERSDYREKTISAALEGRTEFFSELRRPPVAVDAVTEFDRRKDVTATLRPPIRGSSVVAVAPVGVETATEGAVAVDAVPFALDLGEFIATKSESPPALIGDESEIILPTAGLMLLFAKGGRGKTTMTIDLALHLASGVDWLGFEVSRPLRILFIENEGPREPFRAKLESKLACWEHETPDTGLFFHTLDWGAFTFANRDHAASLRAFVEENEIDVLVGDPLDSLGIDGVGSPEDTRRFMELLGQVGLFRDVAFVLLHHPRKESTQDELDEAAGAWGGKPDTMLRLERKEGNRARLSFPKVRWSRRGSRPAYILGFDPETESFTVAHEEEDEERDYLAEIKALLEDGKPRTKKEIAAPKKDGGIGAKEETVESELEGHDVFVSCTGDEAKALDRSPLATVWLLAVNDPRPSLVLDYASDAAPGCGRDGGQGVTSA